MERKEAIEVIKELQPNDRLREALRTLIPELAESEDERIRKFLVKHVSGWIGCIEHDLKISSKDVKSEEKLAMFKAGLAYLEKQKEQKTAEWSEEDENMLSDCIEAVGSMSVRSDVKTLRDWLKSLRPQPHWKPSEEQMEALSNAYRLGKLGKIDMTVLQSLYNCLKKLM